MNNYDIGLLIKWTLIHKNKITYHLIFWSVVWLFYIFLFSYNSSNTKLIFGFSTILMLITATTTYIMVYVVIPKYLNAEKYVWFGIYTFSTLLFTAFSTLLLLVLSVSYIENLKFDNLPPMGRNYAYLVIMVYLITALVGFVSIWRKNMQTALKNNTLQQQLLMSKFKAKEQELTHLKNQIHPHFLFNTLNTIYGLALKKSADTPDIILKLSDLLDYILYQTSKPQVALIDEINHIEHYVTLEKIRFDDTLKIQFVNEVEHKAIQLAPLLLLPFVENAFKHGYIIDNFLRIIINISYVEGVLNFRIKNSYKQSDSKEGIGLKNIKERLNILYPNNYELIIDSESNWYEVNLTINLASK